MISMSLDALRLCHSSLGVVWPDRELLGTRVFWQGPRTPCRKHGASFVCLVPPGEAHCFSTLGELPRLGELAAFASQKVGRLASPRGIRLSQVGSRCWIRGCGVIKTCKVFSSSPLGREVPGPWDISTVEVLLVLVWLSWPQAIVPLASLLGSCQFYPSQICSPGWRQVPVQCRWLEPH